jgi:cytoskeletal protein CcmA (bactofilin family)
MFSKNKRSSAANDLKTKEKPPAPSILGKNIQVTGNIDTDGDIQLEGTVDGDVNTHLLTIGEEAVVNGSITGDTIRVDGTVNGQISARSVRLGKTARVNGDILHETLSIEAGAFVYGMCRNVEQDRQRPDLFSTRPSLVVATEEDSAVNH